jgi:phage portal protein BeeE
MGLTDRLRGLFTPQENRDYWPYVNFNGSSYPLAPILQQTLLGQKEEINGNFTGMTGGAYQGNGIVFACLNARMSLFKQATFMYRRRRSGTPGELWSNPDLEILRTPWPNGTTGDLLARMIQDADLGGNAFILRRPGRLARLRPDWVSFLHGSYSDPKMDMWDADAELLGYWYTPGGPASGEKPVFYQTAEVAHFAPTPDPLAPARGMSWLTPLLREIEADSAATSHKLMYFQNGATPNLVVTGVPGASPEAFQAWVDKFSKGHDNARGRAYKTMYLSGTTDAKVVGSDLAQVDFKVTQGAGETRIAAAAGVPPIVVGLSEGLQGSSLNAGNFQAAMRRFADLTGRSLWQDASGALATIVSVPGDSELWVDDRYIPALKDDIKDAAEVQAKQAQAIRQYVDAGFEPDSVVDAINSGDLKRLKHTGLYSVQLQPPMPEGPPEPEPTEPEDSPDDESVPDGGDTE